MRPRHSDVRSNQLSLRTVRAGCQTLAHADLRRPGIDKRRPASSGFFWGLHHPGCGLTRSLAPHGEGERRLEGGVEGASMKLHLGSNRTGQHGTLLCSPLPGPVLAVMALLARGQQRQASSSSRGTSVSWKEAPHAIHDVPRYRVMYVLYVLYVLYVHPVCTVPGRPKIDPSSRKYRRYLRSCTMSCTYIVAHRTQHSTYILYSTVS